MGKGSSGTNTVTNNSSPPPEVMAQYENLINQGNATAANPLQQYNGQMIAGFTPDQTSAMQTIDNSQGISSPYLGQAQNMINSSQAPLWNSAQQWSPSAIQQYMNPYQQDVTNATMAQINNTDQQQQQSVIGNAISSGAWGGDRSAIAQTQLAGQQALANNSTLAGLNAQNYNQANTEFNQQQGAQLGANTTNAWLASQGAFGEANLGTTAQSNALQGAAAQLATGQQQQTLAQSALNIPYEQFLQQQAYPYQNLSWLSSLSTGLGSGMGGQSSTTSPAPNEFSQDVGTAAGLGSLGYLGYLAYPSIAASDRRIKKDIKRIGMHAGNYGEYPMYNFKYKGDDTPQRGVMAQDVEKINPSAVGENGSGIKYVDYSKLARGGAAPARGFIPHYDSGGTIPNIDLSYIPSSVQTTRGMGIPNSPQPYKAPQSDSSNAVGLLSMMSKNKGSGGGDNPLGLSSGSDFTAGDLSKIGADFDSAGGGFSPGEFGMARGGFADGGIPDADPADDSNFAPGGMDNGPPAGLSPPRAALNPQTAFGQAPAFNDGAGAAPINKVDPILALLATGAGMGAGTSPYFGVNAAAGAQAGIKNLQEQKENAAKESYQQGTLKQQGEKLFDDANEWRNKLFEQQTHDTSSESHAQQQLEETTRHNQADESHASAALAQGKYTMSPYGQVLNNRTGEVTGTPLGGSPVPPGPDGKPLAGDQFMDYLKSNDPDRATRAQMLIDGDKKMPALTSRTDPAWKQSIMDARIADPTMSEERYTNKQKFQADNKGQLDTFNTIPSHLKMLEDAAHALDNGDVQALNSLKNTWKTQIGSELPTNMDTARNMVSAEIVKAITGAGGVSDRKDAQDQFNKAASDGQLSGAVDMAKHLIGERINSAAYRYNQTVNGGIETPTNSYYNYIRPEVRSYLGVGTKPAGADTSSAVAAVAAPPPMSSRVVGQVYTGAGGKKATWNGTGWDPIPGGQ